MKVLIVGCGRLGSELAQLLFQHGNEVSIIDLEESAFDILNPMLARFLNFSILKRSVVPVGALPVWKK